MAFQIIQILVSSNEDWKAAKYVIRATEIRRMKNRL